MGVARSSSRPSGKGSAGTTAKRAQGRAASATKQTPIRKHFIDYPRAGRTGFRRWLPSWRLIFGLFIGMIGLGVGAFAMAYMSIDVPRPNDFATSETTTVYYSDGATIMGTFSAQNRQIIDTRDVSKTVRDAFVAAEDSGFYENAGVDIKGIARALYQNVLGSGNTQGASTITQQYVKNYYLSSDRTWQRKVNEAILAIKIDRQEDKETILDGYLNTIYFGRGAYGLQTAAKVYFDKDAVDLSVSEAAMLAGIVPNPTNWDPRFNAEKAQDRWGYVLNQMVKGGFLSQAERDQQTFPAPAAEGGSLQEYQPSEYFTGTQGYLLDTVRNEIQSKVPSIDDAELESGGYTIITTIDKEAQDKAAEAVLEVPADASPELRVSLITLDVTNGGIVAMIGGKDYAQTQFNNVTQGGAQGGSTYKPFTLVAALSDGHSLNETFDGNNKVEIISGPNQWAPQNFGNVSYGNINLVKATEQSVNSVYAQLNMEVTPERTQETAVAAGLPIESIAAVPANVLGGDWVRPYDLVTAYATFAAQGVKHETHIIGKISKIDRKSGEAKEVDVYTADVKAEQVFSSDVMADATYAMTQVVEQGSGKKAKAVGRPVAGKTGTSTDNKSAWFAGYTTQFATTVGLAQPDENGGEASISIPSVGEVTGSTVPASIWTSYMKSLYKETHFSELPVGQFPKRANVGTVAPPTVEETEEPPVEAEGGENEQVPTPAPTADIKVVVPRVTGIPQADAEAALRAAGIKFTVQTRADPAAAGTALSTNPAAGTAVDPTKSIILIVSSGPAPAPEGGG